MFKMFKHLQREIGKSCTRFIYFIINVFIELINLTKNIGNIFSQINVMTSSLVKMDHLPHAINVGEVVRVGVG